MKVGTDGILIGAWASAISPIKILDIGAGTGLIALMMAQRFSLANVDAIEIDPVASQQAKENFLASPFCRRLSIHHCSLEIFQDQCQALQSYSLIVSNPPWFCNSLKSGSAARDTARHADALSPDALLAAVLKLLDPGGQFAVIMPIEEGLAFVSRAARVGLHCHQRCDVHPTPDKPAKRVLLQFAMQRPLQPVPSESLVVETSVRHAYTEEYQALTKEFYLRF